jgi:hypothetical protein
MNRKLKIFICVLILNFNDIRIKRNVESLINAIIEIKTTKLKTLSKDNREYERYHTLLNGELKNVLDAAKINEAMGLSAAQSQCGKYSVYVVHDECDIRKKDSKKLENLGYVRDLDGKWIRGYSTYNVILIEPDINKIHLYKSVPYSNADPKFVSKKELKLLNSNELEDKERQKEIEDFIETKNNYNSKSICIDSIKEVTSALRLENKDIVITHIFDRGFDDTEIFELIDSLGDNFVIRSKSNRNSNEKKLNEKGNEVFLKLVKKGFANKKEVHFNKIRFKNNTYKNCKGVFEWDTVIINKYLRNVVRIKFYKENGSRIFKDDMLLLTNKIVKDLNMAIYIYHIYMQRPKIENVFKFIKNELGWEKFQVRDYESIKNIIVLAFFIGAYFYEIEDELIDNKYAIWIAELGGGKGKVSLHFFMEGLKKLLLLSYFEDFKKEKNLTQDDIIQALKIFTLE